MRHAKRPGSIGNESGMVLTALLMVSIALSTIIFGMIVLANVNVQRARKRLLLLQAQYAAESGADRAIAEFNNGNTAYTGTGGSDVTLLTNGTHYVVKYTVAVTSNSATEKRVVATGKVFAPAAAATETVSRTIEVIAQQKGTTSASSIVSMGILQISSNVEINGSAVYVNKYIEQTNPNADVRVDTVTVADGKTGSPTCSTGSNGHLILPVSGGSTYNLAYSNCANAASGITVNQNVSGISKIGSIDVPWSYAMDGTYPDMGTCNAWTTGTSPRTINKGHYPDSLSGTTSTCGTSGVLNLGTTTYNITDNVHIRADLCSVSTPCGPTFNNTSGSLKYVFVEGSINFQEMRATSGSPIVFVSYSPLTCCTTNKGAIWIKGTSASNPTNAPKAYFIASKGDTYINAKIDSIGGFSGKNVYINTTGGSSHGLPIDITFPTASIPVDLSWSAVRYRRL